MGIFEKKTWLNRISEYPNRRTITQTDGSNSIVTVTRNEGTVSQEGDAFNAVTMNNLESRIDKAFNDSLGGCQIVPKDGNFYVKLGDLIKKLGSSEGSATSGQVLAGATYNSKYTLDSEEYSVGTMVDNQGKTVTAGTVTNSKTTVTATIPTRACYDTSSKINIPQSAVGNVFDLGTGTSFDIKSLFPNDYARLTASNFLVTDVMSFDMGHTTNDLLGGGRYWCQNTARATVNKSYNATSGVFTCTCSGSNGISGIHLSADSPNFGNYASAVSFTPHVYLILGKITTV